MSNNKRDNFLDVAGKNNDVDISNLADGNPISYSGDKLNSSQAIHQE